MEIEEIMNESNAMLKKLVDCLGLNGDYYISVSHCPMAFSNHSQICEFLTAGSRKLERFLERNNTDEKTKKYILSEGLIVINRGVKEAIKLEGFERIDLFVKIIHEKLHANRMLLTNAQYSGNRGISSVLEDNGRFVLHEKNNQSHYVDSSQDLLKAPIDDSDLTIEKYGAISDFVKEDMTEDAANYHQKMKNQYDIDEALVETMAIVANRLYEQNTTDIMGIIKNLNSQYDGDIKYITNIILRHNNLELFKWMIDPIEYEIGVDNYDFFKNYITDEDMDDLKKLYKAAADMNDEFYDDMDSSKTR